MAQKKSRHYLTVSVALLVCGLLTYGFWPRPFQVDIGEVNRTHLVITINEEGKTRVHDTYVLSAPVEGRLLRVKVNAGDSVVENKTVVAEMVPSYPSLLDDREQTVVYAEIAAAGAGLQIAQAEHEKRIADKKAADAKLIRTQKLLETKVASAEALEQALREAQVAKAALQEAVAFIATRKAELAASRSRLISINNDVYADYINKSENVIRLHAPVTGRVLRLLKESETVLPMGTSIMELGDIKNDLELIVELLSSDAVQVTPGDRVMCAGWGGEQELQGEVQRVEPWGFTKFSALGVEEQRVNAVITFTDQSQQLVKLGHGFRVEVQIVIWEQEDVLVVPANALFRLDREWAVFQVKNGAATLTKVQIGHNNGTQAQVLDGLEAGGKVVLYPSTELVDGMKVVKREEVSRTN